MYSTELNSDLGSNESLKYQSVQVYFEDQNYEYLTLQGVQWEDMAMKLVIVYQMKTFQLPKKEVEMGRRKAFMTIFMMML